MKAGPTYLKDHTRVKDVIISTTDADIDLLISTNAPKAIEQIISSQGEGPYAVRTLLGWVVNGPLKAGTCNDIPSHTVSRISGHKLHEMLIAQYNTDFSERSYEEVKELSIEDRCFLKIANEINQNCGWTLKLLFTKDNVVLPYNRCIAE